MKDLVIVLTMTSSASVHDLDAGRTFGHPSPIAHKRAGSMFFGVVYFRRGVRITSLETGASSKSASWQAHDTVDVPKNESGFTRRGSGQGGYLFGRDRTRIGNVGTNVRASEWLKGV